jgi:outer membrane protein OmpA-like peptidoglycan-associated protein
VAGNIKLSERRAYALSNWLVENNVISAEKITVIGAGDLEPIVNIDSQLPVNRRVEVRINCQRKS